MQVLIDAIRNDQKVGRGSCSSIDECYDSADLIEEFNRLNIATPEEALAWAYRTEGLHLEQGLNQREGNDTDPQLTAWREWNAG